MADPREPPIGYILDWFPSVSETFVLREILALERHGLPLQLFAVKRQSSGPIHEEARALAERAVYRPALASPRLWARQVIWLARRPEPYCHAMAWALAQARYGPRRWVTAVRTVLSAANLASELRERRIRHIHAHFAKRPTTTALLTSRLCGVSFSFTGHACDVFTGEAELLAEKLQEARFAVTCTRAGREALLAHAGVSDSERKTHVVYHGLDLSEWDIPRDPTEPPVVVSVGRLVAKKGFDVLLRACRVLADKGLVFRCEIVGYGPLRATLIRQAAELGLADRVAFIGPVLQSGVREALSRATVFALASRVTTEGHSDGLPNVILEAMAARVPVVATRVAAIPEGIEDGHTGLLAPPDDPEALAAGIQTLFDSPDLRERLAAAGRQRVEEDFDIDANIEPLLRLFEEAIRA